MRDTEAIPVLISVLTSETISAIEEELRENSFSFNTLVFSEIDSLYLKHDNHVLVQNER